MRPWLKISGGVLVTLVLLIVIAGLVMGNEFNARQELVIEASTDEIHDYLMPLHLWREPVQKGLSKEDPSAVVTVDGPESGVGSMLRWRGDDIGEGWVKIVQADEDRGVWYEFGRGDTITARANISYEDHDDGTLLVVNCRGELTPVVGAYFVPYLESKLNETIAWGLLELKKEIEDGTIIDGIFNEVYQFFD
jgi:hypothetical protein